MDTQLTHCSPVFVAAIQPLKSATCRFYSALATDAIADFLCSHNVYIMDMYKYQYL